MLSLRLCLVSLAIAANEEAAKSEKATSSILHDISLHCESTQIMYMYMTREQQASLRRAVTPNSQIFVSLDCTIIGHRNSPPLSKILSILCLPLA